MAMKAISLQLPVAHHGKRIWCHYVAHNVISPSCPKEQDSVNVLSCHRVTEMYPCVIQLPNFNFVIFFPVTGKEDVDGVQNTKNSTPTITVNHIHMMTEN